MALVLCVPGLGGNHQSNFISLANILARNGHGVIPINAECVKTHRDRIELVKAYRNAYPRDDVFIVGHSAGGSAARIAAKELEREGNPVQGIVLIAPAMPFGKFFITHTLYEVMKHRMVELLLGRSFYPTAEEFRKLLEPLPESVRDEVIASRKTVPGPEARRLAFFPPRLPRLKTPALILAPSEDQWISPRTQCTLGRKLAQSDNVDFKEVEGGHFPITSEDHESVKYICDWLNHQDGQP